MKSIFTSCRVANSNLQWHTWSRHTKALLSEISRDLTDITTEIHLVAPGEQYGFSYKPCDPINKNVLNTIDEIANALYLFEPNHGLVLLRDLIFAGFGPSELHVVFSLLSTALNKMESEGLSLHSPIETSSRDKGFPVHADLFISRVLLNVITFKETNNGGDILLLNKDQLQRAMAETPLMPERVKSIIIKLLSGRSCDDRFNEVFGLMYGQSKWSKQLNQNISRRLITIPATTGVGYLLIDGQWLHGRTPVNGPIYSNRLQRLVFNNTTTLRMPSVELNKLDCEYVKGLLRQKPETQRKAIEPWYKAKKQLSDNALQTDLKKAAHYLVG
ncbi:MAG: hypothetical protein AB2652_19860 [Candidatus Thiodiazotropha endolucinida]